MTELYPSETALNALSGTSDPEQGVVYPSIYEAPYYTTFYKMLYRLLDVARRAGDLRVYKDGPLTFGVKPGKFFHEDQWVEFSGASGQALSDNAVNYIYLAADGTLTVNTTGYPVPSVVPHLPLARIAAAGGAYEHDDITDDRGAAFLSPAGEAWGRLLRRDWQDAVADERDFTVAEPAAPAVGQRHLNTASGTSSQTGQTVAANGLYQWNGQSWTEFVPASGACCLVESTGMLKGFNGAVWLALGTFSLWNEVQAFFAATDLTAAEAETLTNGSVADALHRHDPVCTNHEIVCYENELVYA